MVTAYSIGWWFVGEGIEMGGWFCYYGGGQGQWISGSDLLEIVWGLKLQVYNLVHKGAWPMYLTLRLYLTKGPLKYIIIDGAYGRTRWLHCYNLSLSWTIYHFSRWFLSFGSHELPGSWHWAGCVVSFCLRDPSPWTCPFMGQGVYVVGPTKVKIFHIEDHRHLSLAYYITINQSK